MHASFNFKKELYVFIFLIGLITQENIKLLTIENLKKTCNLPELLNLE